MVMQGVSTFLVDNRSATRVRAPGSSTLSATDADGRGAETMKINAEVRWYPFVATAGIFAAAFAVVKLLGD